MTIHNLNKRTDFNDDVKIKNTHDQFQKLLEELQTRELPDDLITFINSKVEEINATQKTGKAYRILVKKHQTKIIQQVEKQIKVVPKNYYRSMWLSLGVAVFGVPLGIAFGVSLGNMGFLGVGIPIGLAIGIAVGASMDKKALEEGRQLDFEIKY